jgi:ankyrin repeat domain-containing protein 50
MAEHQFLFRNPRLCKRIFELVAAAQRPLTSEELRDAISVVPGETAWNVQKLVNDMRNTLDGCGSLLVVDEEHSTVHFAHHSVR